MAASLGMRVAVISFAAMPVAMITVRLEKLAGLLPVMLLAGSRNHGGSGEKGGGDLGLHVGPAG